MSGHCAKCDIPDSAIISCSCPCHNSELEAVKKERDTLASDFNYSHEKLRVVEARLSDAEKIMEKMGEALQYASERHGMIEDGLAFRRLEGVLEKALTLYNEWKAGE